MATEDIIVRMGMDSTAFNRELQKAKVQAKEFKSGMDKLGGAIAGIGLAALTAKVVEYGGKLADMSARLGVSTDALQEFGYAAEQSGGSLEDVAAALQKLAVARANALEGGEAGEKMTAAFAKLGVSLADLRTMRVEDLFRKIGGAIRDTADVQTVLDDATTIFGKNSANVLAAMRNDLDAAAEEAKRLGLIIGDDVIKRLDELGDSAGTFGKRLVADLAGPLVWLVDKLQDIIDFSKIVMLTIAGIGTVLVEQFRGRGADAQRLTLEAMEAEINRIIDSAAERRQQRATRPGLGALNMAEAANGARELLRVQERIQQLEFDALGVAQQRARLADDLQRIEQERANLIANGLLDEKKRAELRLKELEAKKKIAALDDKQREARRRMVELRGERGEAVSEAAEKRGERLKFTLAELAGGNLRGVRDPKLRADIVAARRVMELERQAQFLRNRGGVGDLGLAAERLSAADKLRAGITSATESERFPFQSMDEGIKRVDKQIAELVRKATEEGLNVQALLAK